MTAIQSLGGRLDVATLHAAAAVTATGAGAIKLDLAPYEGSALVLINGAAAGSGVTRLAKIRHCDTSGGVYTDVSGGAFPAIAANTAQADSIQVDTNNLKRFVEIYFTVTGGSGTGVVGAQFVGQKKYNH